ncbi:MAG: hypothetical protein KGQ60_11195, partial [Planctomycetes bacterium]|nr:hypothetical protein [Planctomycetota bacterium]
MCFRALQTVFLIWMIGVSGCVTSRSTDVVDLNKVLDALALVLKESSDTPGAESISVSVTSSDSLESPSVSEIIPSQQDPTKEADFLTRYASKLNELHVMASKVGVSMSQGGEIVGFKDPNGNNVQDLGETKEFTVTIDLQNNRLVASDNHGHHRPYGFRPGGMFTAYLLGSMLGRQNSFYSGAASSVKPNFNNTPMSPPDYRKSVTTASRTRTSSPSSRSSVRTRSGSKGFSFGK